MPNMVRPPCFILKVGASAELESAHGVWHVEVSVMYRTPIAYRVRSTANEPPSECPPSTPVSEQSCWFLCASMMSAEERERDREGELVKTLQKLKKYCSLLREGREEGLGWV